MRFELLLPAAIEADWERIGGLLAPAIARDDQRQAIDVYRDLMTGALALFDCDLAKARGVVVVQIGKPCFWIIYITGKIDGPPREWRGRVRTLASYFEGVARAHDCAELRIEGRDWSRILPDYLPTGEKPGRNELRKVL